MVEDERHMRTFNWDVKFKKNVSSDFNQNLRIARFKSDSKWFFYLTSHPKNVSFGTHRLP